MRLCPLSLLGIVFSLSNNKQTAQASGHVATWMRHQHGRTPGGRASGSVLMSTAHNRHVWGEDHLAQKYFQLHKSNKVLDQTKRKGRYIHLRDLSICYDACL